MQNIQFLALFFPTALLTISLLGCVAGTDSTNHDPISSGIEGEGIVIRLRTAPAENFKDVAIVLSPDGQRMGVFPMRQIGVVNKGDEYEYRLLVPKAVDAKFVDYSFTFTNSGRVSGSRTGGKIKVFARENGSVTSPSFDGMGFSSGDKVPLLLTVIPSGHYTAVAVQISEDGGNIYVSHQMSKIARNDEKDADIYQLEYIVGTHGDGFEIPYRFTFLNDGKVGTSLGGILRVGSTSPISPLPSQK